MVIDIKEFDYSIESLVVSIPIEYSKPIELDKIKERFQDVEYNPNEMPALLIKDKNLTFLVFAYGPMIIKGVKNMDETDKATQFIIEKLKEEGITATVQKSTIQKIVVKGDLHSEVDLEKAFKSLKNVKYDPEDFPALFYKLEKPKCMVLVTAEGKIVCNGLSELNEIELAMKNFYNEIKKFKINK